LALPVDKSGKEKWLPEEEERLLETKPKNISAECYRTRRECDSRCAVSCDENDECEGVPGRWFQYASNYWLVIILMIVLALFLIVFFVACQCVDKGQGCDNVDLYPRILGNHRRSQRRGINTVQYFTAVRAGQGRKSSVVSHNSSINQHRASISSQTPLSVASNYRYL